MPAISMKVEGGKALDRKLLKLGTKTGKKVARKATRAGAKVFQAAIKENAVSMVGGDMGSRIAGAVVVRALKVRRGQVGVRALIDPKKNDQFIHITQEGDRQHIPTAIEYGHARPGAGGSGSKDVAAIPYARQAFDSNENKAASVVRNEMIKGIEFEGKKP